MKSLQQFLEAHNFLIKGHTKDQSKSKRITFNFPELEIIEPHDTYKFKSFKKIKIGEGPFYIYNDKYHGRKHIVEQDDLAASIGCWYDDFEDFSEKDIINDFKTLKEAVIYMLKENGLNDTDINNIIQNEDDTIISDKHGTKGYYDTDSFAYDVLIGNVIDDDVVGSGEGVIGTLMLSSTIQNLPKNWNKLKEFEK